LQEIFHFLFFSFQQAAWIPPVLHKLQEKIPPIFFKIFIHFSDFFDSANHLIFKNSKKTNLHNAFYNILLREVIHIIHIVFHSPQFPYFPMLSLVYSIYLHPMQMIFTCEKKRKIFYIKFF